MSNQRNSSAKRTSARPHDAGVLVSPPKQTEAERLLFEMDKLRDKYELIQINGTACGSRQAAALRKYDWTARYERE